MIFFFNLRSLHKKLYLCKDCVEYVCSATVYSLTHAAVSREIGPESLIFAYKFYLKCGRKSKHTKLPSDSWNILEFVLTALLILAIGSQSATPPFL